MSNGSRGLSITHSYLFAVSEWRDSNSRPPAPKAGTLTGLRYTPNVSDGDAGSGSGWIPFMTVQM